MAWIQVHQSLWTHRKTVTLASFLGVSHETAATKMIRLWSWALDNTPDGDVSDLPAEVIAFAADYDGDADVFLKGMIKAGFVDRTDDRLCLHDWQSYAGRLVAQRKANAERMRRARAKHVKHTLPEHEDISARDAHVHDTFGARAPARGEKSTEEERVVGGTNTSSHNSSKYQTTRARERTDAGQVIEVLGVGGNDNAESIVRETVLRYSEDPTVTDARRCREHYQHWEKRSPGERAGLYAKFEEKAHLFRQQDAVKYGGPPRASPADELPWLPDDPDDEARVRKWDEDLKAQAKTRGSKHG